MDQHWGDDDWHHDGDYAGDADTADLSGPDTPLSGAFDQHGDDGHPGADPTGGIDQPDLHTGGADGGGYLEDDPMGGFGHDASGHALGDSGHDVGHDSGHDAGSDTGHDADAEIPPLDAGLHDDPGVDPDDHT